MEETPLVKGNPPKREYSSNNSTNSEQESLFFTQPKFIRRWLILLIISLSVIAFLTSKWLRSFFAKNDILPNSQDYYTNLLGNNPFSDYGACEDESNPPSLGSYHIHAVFDGNDKDATQTAISTFYQFKEYINPNMDECPFSHNDAGLSQNEICYFSFYFDENDFPVSSHKLWNAAQYAFFVPSDYVEIALNWWMQHHTTIDNNGNSLNIFDIAMHPAIGCQEMGHSKWLITNNEFSQNIIYENLPCCHTGPASCTCDLVSFKDENSQLCLSLNYNENNNDDNQLSFQLTQCQEYSMVQNVKDDSDSDSNENTGLYSGFWRETFYDSDNNWIQIENYGAFDDYIPKNTYLCMTVDSNDENKNEIKMDDCSVSQNSENNEWIADISKFTYDNSLSKIRYLGDDSSQLCLYLAMKENENENESENESKMVDARLVNCEEATSLTRIFFP